MTRDHELDDFHPSDWATDLEASAGFVDRTLERVLADRRALEDEAARVDDLELPREVLDAYTTPHPSTDFAARTAAAVAAARENDWRRTLDSFPAPDPTEEFVERTLAALRLDRSGLRLVRGGDGVESRRPTRALGIAVAAAAIAILALGAWFVLDGRSAAPAPEAVRTTDRAFSPVPWSSALAALATETAGDLDFQPVAGLLAGRLR